MDIDIRGPGRERLREGLIVIAICTFLYLCFNMLNNSQSDSNDQKKKKRQDMNRCSATDARLPKDVTVLDRKKINGNWENFVLNSQKNKEFHPENKIHKYSWGSTQRVEKQHNLKSGSITNLKKDFHSSDSNISHTKFNHYKTQLNVTDTAVSVSNRESGVIVKNPTGQAGTLTKCVAIDCEMVGVGSYGRESILARVSLVNKFGDCIYDKFVKPRFKVTDYRTPVSGVRASDLVNGEAFEVVQKEVADILKGRILVGHALKKDLDVLFLSHPNRQQRDTSKYKPFRKLVNGRTPSLKHLTKELLGANIQSGEHSSVEDAKAAMLLYAGHERQWESAVRRRKGGPPNSAPQIVL